MKSGKPVAKDVDTYLKRLPEDQRATLEKLRKAIRSAAPGAEELISYQIPMYKQNGFLVSFAAFEKHLSFFVINKNLMKTFEEELKPFRTSGVTIHFTPDKPLPASLVQKIVRIRVKENEEVLAARQGEKVKSQKSKVKNQKSKVKK